MYVNNSQYSMQCVLLVCRGCRVRVAMLVLHTRAMLTDISSPCMHATTTVVLQRQQSAVSVHCIHALLMLIA
jgi:hypothetical protein